jgi:hypothetical protein
MITLQMGHLAQDAYTYKFFEFWSETENFFWLFEMNYICQNIII